MLYLKEQTFDSLWAVWRIDESREQLLSMLTRKSMLEKEVLSLKSESKVTERLAVRVLLKHLLGKEVEISYEKSGRPYIKDENVHLSISHTKQYVAVILSKKDYIGIDIQHITDKVKNVQSKFVSDEEFIDADNELIHLLLHWSAKETIYKALGDGVDLKRSFSIEHFIPARAGQFRIVEKLTGADLQYTITYLVHPDFVLTHI